MKSEAISDFQLIGTRLGKIEVTNNFVTLPPSDELDVNIDMGNSKINIPEYPNKSNSLEGVLQQYINFSATCKNCSQDSIKISVMIEGFFVTNEKDKNRFKQMLLLNGNTALYSILRSYVISISAMSLEEGKIVLPMINFTKLIEQEDKE